MRDGVRPLSRPRRFSLIRGALRWRPRTYLQVWAIVASSYLACALIFPLIPWHGQRVNLWAALAIPWILDGLMHSYKLHRRRTS
jgi:hypothetical protein